MWEEKCVTHRRKFCGWCSIVHELRGGWRVDSKAESSILWHPYTKGWRWPTLMLLWHRLTSSDSERAQCPRHRGSRGFQTWWSQAGHQTTPSMFRWCHMARASGFVSWGCFPHWELSHAFPERTDLPTHFCSVRQQYLSDHSDLIGLPVPALPWLATTWVPIQRIWEHP